MLLGRWRMPWSGEPAESSDPTGSARGGARRPSSRCRGAGLGAIVREVTAGGRADGRRCRSRRCARAEGVHDDTGTQSFHLAWASPEGTDTALRADEDAGSEDERGQPPPRDAGPGCGGRLDAVRHLGRERRDAMSGAARAWGSRLSGAGGVDDREETWPCRARAPRLGACPTFTLYVVSSADPVVDVVVDTVARRSA